MDASPATPVRRSAVVIVAHPDDEVLWAGGTILSRADWNWTVIALCRASDPDRRPRFDAVQKAVGTAGFIGDLDDGPDQSPLAPAIVQGTILSLLPRRSFDIVLTHGPRGEYTRHRRHEETCRAVVELWCRGELHTGELWMFAYDDQAGTQLPTACDAAPRFERLPETVWTAKHRLITECYGFTAESWEARVTPTAEAFWPFDAPAAARQWIAAQGNPT